MTDVMDLRLTYHATPGWAGALEFSGCGSSRRCPANVGKSRTLREVFLQCFKKFSIIVNEKEFDLPSLQKHKNPHYRICDSQGFFLSPLLFSTRSPEGLQCENVALIDGTIKLTTQHASLHNTPVSPNTPVSTQSSWMSAHNS